MRRYTITLGAATTAGGKVTSASSTISISGVRVALEGDDVWCPVCGAAGKIKCDGPRLNETFMGKQVALGGDLCICGCSVPPRLIAKQTLRSQNLEGAAIQQWAGAAAPSHFLDTDVSARVQSDPDAGYLFIDEHSGDPLSGAKFAVLRDGSARRNVADGEGRGKT